MRKLLIIMSIIAGPLLLTGCTTTDREDAHEKTVREDVHDKTDLEDVLEIAPFMDFLGHLKKMWDY